MHMKEGWKMNKSLKFLSVILFFWILLCGCATTVVTIKPMVDLPQSVTQVPMTIGVYESPDFRAYEYIADRYTLPVGQASVSLFQELFPKTFKKVVWLETPPPINTAGQKLSAIIEPRIEGFQLYALSVGQGFKIWAEIHYGFTVYSTDGVVLASWTVKGGGESSLTIDQAVNNAMQEVSWRFITGFNDSPEAKRWAEGLLQKGAEANGSAQTTHSAPQFGKEAVVGVYPGIVAVSAEANPDMKGQSVELSTHLKESGLLPIRVEVKNRGDHRLLIRHRDITIVRPDGTEIGSLPASIFAALSVKPHMKGWTAPAGVGVGALPLGFAGLLNAAAISAEYKELNTCLSIYQDKELYDTTLTRGRSVQGYAYFFVPVEVASLEDLKLVVPVIDFDSATRYIVRLPLKLP